MVLYFEEDLEILLFVVSSWNFLIPGELIRKMSQLILKKADLLWHIDSKWGLGPYVPAHDRYLTISKIYKSWIYGKLFKKRHTVLWYILLTLQQTQFPWKHVVLNEWLISLTEYESRTEFRLKIRQLRKYWSYLCEIYKMFKSIFVIEFVSLPSPIFSWTTTIEKIKSLQL